MKNVWIIRSENRVQVDGKPHWVDCSALSAIIRVIQWDAVKSQGEYEFVRDANDRPIKNMKVTSTEDFQFAIDKWFEAEETAKAKAAADAAAKAEAEAAPQGLK